MLVRPRDLGRGGRVGSESGSPASCRGPPPEHLGGRRFEAGGACARRTFARKAAKQRPEFAQVGFGDLAPKHVIETPDASTMLAKLQAPPEKSPAKTKSPKR